MRIRRILGLKDSKTVRDIRTFRGVKCTACNGTGIEDTRLSCCICGGSGIVRAI